jgi:phage baseplate assembly protein W
MPVQRVSRGFKDISLSFEPHPVTKDLPVIKNESAILRAVRNLVQTVPTERVFNSALGSEITQSLFEFVDYGTAAVIREQIITSIKNFEPRVTNLVVEVTPDPDLNSFEVDISFDILGQETPAQQFTFILEATR